MFSKGSREKSLKTKSHEQDKKPTFFQYILLVLMFLTQDISIASGYVSCGRSEKNILLLICLIFKMTLKKPSIYPSDAPKYIVTQADLKIIRKQSRAGPAALQTRVKWTMRNSMAQWYEQNLKSKARISQGRDPTGFSRKGRRVSKSLTWLKDQQSNCRQLKSSKSHYIVRICHLLILELSQSSYPSVALQDVSSFLLSSFILEKKTTIENHLTRAASFSCFVYNFLLLSALLSCTIISRQLLLTFQMLEQIKNSSTFKFFQVVLKSLQQDYLVKIFAWFHILLVI